MLARKWLLSCRLHMKIIVLQRLIFGGLLLFLCMQARLKAPSPFIQVEEVTNTYSKLQINGSVALATYTKLRAQAREVYHLDTNKGSHNKRRADLTGSGSLPLTIAQFSHVYGPNPLWTSFSSNQTFCQRTCHAVGEYGDVLAAASADAVIFNLASLSSGSGAPWTRPPGQVWIGTYFESPDHYPSSKDKNMLAEFNLIQGFRPNDDLPVLNMVFDTFKDFERVRHYTLPTWESKRAHRTPMISVWISNCAVDSTQRLAFLDELALHGITYASYGRCRNTHDAKVAVSSLKDDDWQQYAKVGPGQEKTAAATKHLFFYAAENSYYPYYITEKVFHGLLAGSVPVYIGDAKHLKMVAPPHSIIYAEDYGSSKVLADHLIAVANDNARYEDYLAWRSDLASLRQLERIMALPRWAKEHPHDYACAVCELLHSYS